MDNCLPHLASGKTFLTFDNDVQQETSLCIVSNVTQCLLSDLYDGLASGHILPWIVRDLGHYYIH